MDHIRTNTPVPIKANLMTELFNVQMSWGNGGCTRAGSPGDQQTRDVGPWVARRSRAMMRANAWGHDELMKSFGIYWSNMIETYLSMEIVSIVMYWNLFY